MTSMDTADHISGVYSQSLFDLAMENQSIDNVKNDLDILSKLIVSEEDFLFFLSSPLFSVWQKQQLFRQTCANFTDLTMNFIMVAISHNRLSFLPSIIQRYEKLYLGHYNYCRISVTVSQAVSEDETAAIKASLASAINNDKIILEMTVDPSIIGGAVIRYDDKVIDNSIKNRLHNAIDQIMTVGIFQGKSYEA